MYFGLLQLVFNLSWVIYVIYLPQLAHQAGIAGWAVPWILVADHAWLVGGLLLVPMIRHKDGVNCGPQAGTIVT
ncbi:hypothetical protein MHPYR_30091 [uncultured Mycobacterium sp.]|uniref:Uncharacterized protein n=1 Tax=uncultured Mycobacterium sp. TaxID=171292 RepID=A0A1Y5PBL6_9MYCO|nr:hypothetical protein MHPYR_30091 [uncultured Mycobacterium sp.]